MRRLGIILISIGLSLVIITLFEDYSTSYISGGVFTVLPGEEKVLVRYFGLRTIRVLIEYKPSFENIDVRIIEGEALKNVDKFNIKNIVEFQDVNGLDYTFKTNMRGLYGIVIKNKGHAPISVSVRFFLSGYDYDIIYAGITLILIGIILLVVDYVLYWKNMSKI
ncbi:MAG: hypothetical protein J7K23_02245 [Thermoproteales archaeon]|nr:hypothetical protein [Thermoproteales archaeon]